MTWVDRHAWMPLLRGTDGLTGRQRRRLARRYNFLLHRSFRLAASSSGTTEDNT